jgi:hypothetical protein
MKYIHLNPSVALRKSRQTSRMDPQKYDDTYTPPTHCVTLLQPRQFQFCGMPAPSGHLCSHHQAHHSGYHHSGYHLGYHPDYRNGYHKMLDLETMCLTGQLPSKSHLFKLSSVEPPRLAFPVTVLPPQETMQEMMTKSLSPSHDERLSVYRSVFEWLKSNCLFRGIGEKNIALFVLGDSRSIHRPHFSDPTGIIDDVRIFMSGKSFFSIKRCIIDDLHKHLWSYTKDGKLDTNTPAWRYASLYHPRYRALWMREKPITHIEAKEMMSKHINPAFEDAVHNAMNCMFQFLSDRYRELGYIWNGYFGFYREHHPLFLSWNQTLSITPENVRMIYPDTPELSWSQPGQGWSKIALKTAIIAHNGGTPPQERGFMSRASDDDADIVRYNDFKKALTSYYDYLSEYIPCDDGAWDILNRYVEEHPGLQRKLTQHNDMHLIGYVELYKNMTQ